MYLEKFDFEAEHIYYIEENGDDSNDGLSSVTAWKTFSKAQAVATMKDAVHVGEGYFHHQSIGGCGSAFFGLDWKAGLVFGEKDKTILEPVYNGRDIDFICGNYGRKFWNLTCKQTQRGDYGAVLRGSLPENKIDELYYCFFDCENISYICDSQALIEPHFCHFEIGVPRSYYPSPLTVYDCTFSKAPVIGNAFAGYINCSMNHSTKFSEVKEDWMCAVNQGPNAWRTEHRIFINDNGSLKIYNNKTKWEHLQT